MVDINALALRGERPDLAGNPDLLDIISLTGRVPPHAADRQRRVVSRSTSAWRAGTRRRPGEPPAADRRRQRPRARPPRPGSPFVRAAARPRASCSSPNREDDQRHRRRGLADQARVGDAALDRIVERVAANGLPGELAAYSEAADVPAHEQLV